jgi:hypothetical protein
VSDNAVSRYDLAEQIVRAQLQRDALDEQIASLKAEFRDGQSEDLEKDGRPKIIVKVTPNSRIDDRLAREHLDEELYFNLSKRSIDTAKARAFLTNEDLAKITKHYENKVEVKLA